MRVEPAGPDGGLQCTDMNVEFLGQLAERQPFVLPLMMGDRFARALQHRDGDSASPTIQWPVGFERNRQQRSELALPQTDRSTQLAHR